MLDTLSAGSAVEHVRHKCEQTTGAVQLKEDCIVYIGNRLYKTDCSQRFRERPHRYIWELQSLGSNVRLLRHKGTGVSTVNGLSVDLPT